MTNLAFHKNKEEDTSLKEYSRILRDPFLITTDKRGLNIKIIREDLLKIILRISQKLSDKLSRKISSSEDTIKISCSEHHHESVSQKVISFFNFLITCKCGEKEVKYLKKNFYCSACGYIISSNLKFKKYSH